MKAAKRKSLPASSFVYPKQRKYPIDTKKRAKAALSYGARRDTFGSASYIKGKVYKRYPSLKPKKSKSSKRRKRK
jgi:hypothetical protein